MNNSTFMIQLSIVPTEVHCAMKPQEYILFCAWSVGYDTLQV